MNGQLTPDSYLIDRVEDQINWYSNSSKRNQQWYKMLRVIELIFASIIPFLVNQINDQTPLLKIAVGVMGMSIAIISGIISLFKYQENWIEYRTTAESLKHEKYLFLTETSPYNTEYRYHLFVERVESLISKENSTWARNLNEKTKENEPS
jgi:hypothetical protein